MLLPPRCQKIGTPHILDMDITRDALPKTLHKIKGSSNCSCTNRKKRKGNSILRRVVPRLHFPVDETGSLPPLDFPGKPKIPFLCVKVSVCGWGGRQGMFDFSPNYQSAKWLYKGASKYKFLACAIVQFTTKMIRPSKNLFES